MSNSEKTFFFFVTRRFPGNGGNLGFARKNCFAFLNILWDFSQSKFMLLKFVPFGENQNLFNWNMAQEGGECLEVAATIDMKTRKALPH